MILPGCQDTGTAICMGRHKNLFLIINKFKYYQFNVKGKRGQEVWTDGNDEAHISRGVYNTYTKRNLRYSQVAPLDMYTEKKYN